MNDEQNEKLAAILFAVYIPAIPWGDAGSSRDHWLRIARAAEEATREQHYREALAKPCEEDINNVLWEVPKKEDRMRIARALFANRLTRLLPKPQTDPAIEAAANAIRQPGSMVGAGVVEKIVAAVRKADASLPPPPPASDPQPVVYQEAKPAAQCKHEHPRRGYHPGEYFCGDCKALITHAATPQAAPDATAEIEYGNPEPLPCRLEIDQTQQEGAAMTADKQLTPEQERAFVEAHGICSVHALPLEMVNLIVANPEL